MRRRERLQRQADQHLRNARVLADELATGLPLPGHTYDPWLAPGEQTLINTVYDVWRYRSAEVVYNTPGYFAIGRPAFVLGAVLGNLAASATARRNAQRQAVPQWRNYGPHACLLTTSRALFHLDGQWEGVNIADLHGIQPYPVEHTLDLYYEPEPIRLVGDAAPWMSVALLYLTCGPTGLRHPALRDLTPARQTR